MALFQSSVLKGYLKRQDSEEVSKAYKKFAKYFHNAETQQNIREIKEEGFQQKFLMELFVNVFGYTINPDPKYNLTTEYKNEKGAKKADGAILKDENALGVIELKSTKTKDLEKVRQQAFDYKANQTGCIYVITSNFEKVRFYINNAVDYEEFDLFTLTEQQFSLLFLCLSKNNILNNIPLKIKEESIQEEEKITKKFYAVYSLFKRELYRDLVKQNMKNEVFRAELNREDFDRANKNIKHTLFKKSQKLIDRFLFIFFAEDRDLLPPNSTLMILKDWDRLNELDAAVPLYDRFKLYFNYLDTGRKGTDKKAEIFAYNGGLFKPDAILDSLLISDDLLYKNTRDLSHYDFASQVDVNILGHIFENSLNEIESINAEIEGTDFDKQKTKRKKDGVFYTPKYITKYIVDNTVGKLCEDKKTELNIVEDEYLKKRKGRTTKKLKELQDKLENYRNWLLQITICDPACGSGAFLNQALDFLINEHHYIDELQASLLGGGFVFPDIENTILENNIYGVDLNEESVEIAKLSLWLRTAQPRRKLNDLSDKIKCGNSLIDSKSVAGDKAFNWEEEFPEIFAKGGFDIVIGNPPYVQLQKLGDESDRLKRMNFRTYERTGDLYALFYEKGSEILKKNGLLSFITGSAWLRSNYGKSLRNFFLSETQILQVIDFSDCKIFEDATVLTSIVTYQKSKVGQQKVKALRLTKENQSLVRMIGDYFDSNHTLVETFDENSWIIPNKNEYKVILKVEKQGIALKNWNVDIFRGILTGYNDAFIVSEEIKNQLIKEHPSSEELLKPIIRGRDVTRYNITDSNLWLIATFPALNINIEKYPSIKRYLESFGKKIYQTGEFFINDEGKKDKSRKKTSNEWFETQDTIAYYEIFEKPKIIYPNMTKFLPFVLDKSNFYTNQKCFLLSGDYLEFLVCFFNSKLFRFCFEEYFPELQGNTREMNKVIFQELPVKTVDKNINKIFEKKSEAIHQLNDDKESIKSSFVNLLETKFSISASNKLSCWYGLEYSDFIKELENVRKKTAKEKDLEYAKIPLVEEDEWMQFFNDKKLNFQRAELETDKVDKEIDLLVYSLYDLTYEDVQIIDDSFSMSKNEYEQFKINCGLEIPNKPIKPNTNNETEEDE